MSWRFTLWRLLQVVPTALGIVLVGFVLVHAAPGDPVLVVAGEHGDADYYAFMRGRFGLDRPLPEQIITYFGRVLRGDLGTSRVHGRPVLEVIAERAPATLLLTGSALLVSTLAGILAGIIAARRPGSGRDGVITAVTLTLYAAPVFWLGQLAILIFAFHLGLFPVQGMTAAAGATTGLGGLLDIAHHLALPVLVLASQEVTAVTRLTLTGLIDELASDHVRTARAKGLAERAVLVRHALPRALLSVLTVVGARVGHLIAGAVIVEIVFGWPGIGRLMLTALQTRDAPILLGIFFVVALAVILANVLTDLMHAAFDPRVRYR